jgi:hypothetical protein
MGMFDTHTFRFFCLVNFEATCNYGLATKCNSKCFGRFIPIPSGPAAIPRYGARGSLVARRTDVS